MDDHAALCLEVLARYTHENVHVADHSMGETIAVLFCGLMGKRAASFVNIEGNLVGADCTVSRRAVTSTYERFRKRLMRELVIAARSSEEKGMRLWAEWSAWADPLAFTKSARSLVEWSDGGGLLRRLLNMPCPRAYFYRERDAGMPVLARLGAVQTIMIQDSGHFLMNDNTGEFYRAVAEFISR